MLLTIKATKPCYENVKNMTCDVINNQSYKTTGSKHDLDVMNNQKYKISLKKLLVIIITNNQSYKNTVSKI